MLRQAELKIYLCAKPHNYLVSCIICLIVEIKQIKCVVFVVFVFSNEEIRQRLTPLPSPHLPTTVSNPGGGEIKTMKDDLSVLADCRFKYLFTFLS